jgi:hypothetical protein
MNNVVGHKMAIAFLFMLASANALSNDLVQLVRSSSGDEVGKITVQPYELFARRDIGGASSIYEFLNNTVLKAQGICNVDKARLATNEAFIFNEIAINFSLGDTGQVGAVDYISKLPASVRNAEFEIIQNGRVVLNVPVATLHNPYTGQNQADQWTQLGSLCYLSDNEEFTWRFKFPSGATVTAGSTAGTFPYAEVRLRGHRTIKRAV